MSEKDEFLILLRNIEKKMRVNPVMLLNSPDYAETVERFNSLVPLVSSFHLSSEESKEVQALWSSLKKHIGKRATKVEEMAQLSPQERLFRTLKSIITKWKIASRDEKKEFISEAQRLQADPSVMSKMTPIQLREYRELMETIREMAIIEQISPEGSERKKIGL